MAKCDCGAEVKNPNHHMHLESERHKGWLGANGKGKTLPRDLQAVLDSGHDTPQNRAKMVRGYFSAHPEERDKYGNVAGFLEKHNIPITPPLR